MSGRDPAAPGAATGDGGGGGGAGDGGGILVERLDAEGHGRAGDALLPGTLPGERVALGSDGRVRILVPAPGRVRPPCPHAGPCGGCTLQHAAGDTVAAFKTARLAEALAAVGLAPPIRPIVTVPARARRRVALGARRLKSGVSIGFHRRGSDQIVPVEDCLVARPALVACLPGLAPLAARLASRKQPLRLTLTEAEEGIDAAVEGAKPPDAGTRAALAGLAREAGLARLSLVEGQGGRVLESVTLAPPRQRLGPARVLPPPGAFLQPTAEGAAALLDGVTEALGLGAPGGPGRGARLVDLFAGIGTFALPLSARAEMLAVELDAAALAALDAGWREAAPLAGLARLRTEARNLFRRPLTAAELAPFAGAVIDPPFAGAEGQARALAASPVPRIAAVSCNPASFARDAAILAAGGYRLDWVQPVDQFRWSGHLEIVAAFRRP